MKLLDKDKKSDTDDRCCLEIVNQPVRFLSVCILLNLQTVILQSGYKQPQDACSLKCLLSPDSSYTSQHTQGELVNGICPESSLEYGILCRIIYRRSSNKSANYLVFFPYQSKRNKQTNKKTNYAI